jgi:hypothetical protein
MKQRIPRVKRKCRKKYIYTSDSTSSSTSSSSDEYEEDENNNSIEDQQDPDYYNEEDRKIFAEPSERLLPWSIFYGVQAPVLLVIVIIWWSQYEWHPSVSHRYFYMSPTEYLFGHAILIGSLFFLSMYIWWIEYIGARLCGCCCLITTFLYRLSLIDGVVSVMTTISLGKPYFFHHDKDVHWPNGLGSTFLLSMMSGFLCFFGSIRFARVTLKISKMKSPKHRTYGAKFHLVEDGGRHVEHLENVEEGGPRMFAGTYEMSQVHHDTPKSYESRKPSNVNKLIIPEDNERIQRNLKYRVLLRPMDPSPPITPQEFESMWSSRWGAPTTVHYHTSLKPNCIEISETFEENNIHIIAKGQDKLYFCAREVTYNLETQRPGTGYNTARRCTNNDAWSLSPGYETSPLVLCEMRLLSNELIEIELRCDDQSISNIVSLYVELYYGILRLQHGVYKQEYI